MTQAENSREPIAALDTPPATVARIRLHAAATELLDFVKDWLNHQGSDDNYMTAKARTLITKVTGEPE